MVLTHDIKGLGTQSQGLTQLSCDLAHCLATEPKCVAAG